MVTKYLSLREKHIFVIHFVFVVIKKRGSILNTISTIARIV